MNSNELYKAMVSGWEAQQKKESAHETSKQGTLRGGNSGCITPEGIILGSDPREALLRAFGIQVPSSFDDTLLFQAGHTNEDSVAEYLDAAGISYLREEQCPISWECTVDDGVEHPILDFTNPGSVGSTQVADVQILQRGHCKPQHGVQSLSVSGRPDFLLGGVDTGLGNDVTGVPTVGIELKGIFGTGTLVDVAHFAGATPKVDNVCQAAHYSWQKNKIPWILMYVNRSYHTVFYYGANKFPVDHRAVKRDAKTDKAVVVGPFITMYDLVWEGDRLTIDGKPSLITASGINHYYQYLVYCYHNRIIPRSHDPIDVYGNRMKKDKQAQYYDFGEADTSRGFDVWLEQCKEIAHV